MNKIFPVDKQNLDLLNDKISAWHSLEFGSYAYLNPSLLKCLGHFIPAARLQISNKLTDTTN